MLTLFCQKDSLKGASLQSSPGGSVLGLSQSFSKIQFASGSFPDEAVCGSPWH